jgi:SAM-dependent methyltransferase
MVKSARLFGRQFLNAPSTLPQPHCLLCGAPGTPLYRQLRDQLYGVAGSWDMSQCPACRVAWLDPQPADFGALYAHYYTHGEAAPQTWRARRRARGEKTSVIAGKLALGYPVEASAGERLAARWRTLFRPAREMAAMRLAGLEAPPRGAVLDIGCGSGMLLATLKQAGWDVEGLEADPKAAAAARARGLVVHQGLLGQAALGDKRFAAIILNHVIEHVPDPIAYLRECGRLLAPGGRIIVLTPNLAGFAHRHFRGHWRGLEIPRHLVIFSPASLRATGDRAGLHVAKATTLVRGARFMYTQGARMRDGRTNIECGGTTSSLEKARRLAMSYLFQGLEWLAILNNPDAGDEILMQFSTSETS